MSLQQYGIPASRVWRLRIAEQAGLLPHTPLLLKTTELHTSSGKNIMPKIFQNLKMNENKTNDPTIWKGSAEYCVTKIGVHIITGCSQIEQNSKKIFFNDPVACQLCRDYKRRNIYGTCYFFFVIIITWDNLFFTKVILFSFHYLQLRYLNASNFCFLIKAIVFCHCNYTLVYKKAVVLLTASFHFRQTICKINYDFVHFMLFLVCI